MKSMDIFVKNLISEYKKKKYKIKNRLKDFKNLYRGKDKDIFAELCFCILTPQSKAIYCDKAVAGLQKSDLLFKGSEHGIKAKLKGLARFHNKKAAYIVGAREACKSGKRLNVKKKLDANNALKTREWLVRNIKGLGYKEASHFLRNIGLARDMAILDVHILRNLKKYGVIKRIPGSITEKNYINIENKVREFAKKTNIPLEELDLLFWSGETGFIFK